MTFVLICGVGPHSRSFLFAEKDARKEEFYYEKAVYL